MNVQNDSCIFSIDPNIVLSNKLVRQSEEDLPAKSQNVMKFSTQLLISDSIRIRIYEKNYKIKLLNAIQISIIHPKKNS